MNSLKKTFLIPLLILLLSFNCYSQELNCVVTVNADQILGTQDRVFETLEKDIFEFISSTLFHNSWFEELWIWLFQQRDSAEGMHYVAQTPFRWHRKVFQSMLQCMLWPFALEYTYFSHKKYNCIQKKKMNYLKLWESADFSLSKKNAFEYILGCNWRLKVSILQLPHKIYYVCD